MNVVLATMFYVYRNQSIEKIGDWNQSVDKGGTWPRHTNITLIQGSHEHDCQLNCFAIWYIISIVFKLPTPTL